MSNRTIIGSNPQNTAAIPLPHSGRQASIKKIVHQAPQRPGRDSHPTNATFHTHSGKLAQSLSENCHCHADSHAENHFHSQTVDSLFRKVLKSFIKAAAASGFRLQSTPNLTERARGYAEDWSVTAARREVVEGQDSSLNQADDRAARMKSKSTAFLEPNPKDAGWKPLTGRARSVYNGHIQTALNKGNPTAHKSIGLNQQKDAIANHLSVNSEILVDFLLSSGLMDEPPRQQTAGAVNQLFKKLGLNVSVSQKADLSKEGIQAQLQKHGALGEQVWTVAQGAATLLQSPGKVYEGLNQNVYFDHKAGAQRPLESGERQFADRQKIIGILVERELDRPFESELVNLCRTEGFEAVRFSGNSFNVPGLYGAQNAGFDGAREATFRVKLRMGAKRLVVDQLKSLRGDNVALQKYVESLSPALVKEFLATAMPEESASHQDAAGVLSRTLSDDNLGPDMLSALESSYPSVLFGPCGTLQGAMNHVGGVLGAMQHVTGQTSLWCMHNGDFEEVGGLQGDPATRTYMKLDEQSQLYSMFANHPELKRGQDGKPFLPIDCVHSQAYLNLPGMEEEATGMLRIILSDILPDVSRLNVKVSATSTRQGGGDLPYVGGQGQYVIGSTRFANFPHAFKVSANDESVSQEQMVIEAVEFTYDIDGSGSKRPLFISTQNHDDAAKGNVSYLDFGDDSAIFPRDAINDGAERTLFKTILGDWVVGQPRQRALPASTDRNSNNVVPAHGYGIPAEALDSMQRAIADIQPVAAEPLSLVRTPVGFSDQSVAIDSGSLLDQLQEHGLLTDVDEKLVRNLGNFKAVTLKGSPASLLLDLVFKKPDGNYSAPSVDSFPEMISQRLESMDPAHARAIADNLPASLDHIAKWIKLDLMPSVADDDVESTPDVHVFNRPRSGLQDASNRPVLPSGVIGSVAVPSTVGAGAGLASAATPALGVLGQAALAGVGVAGTGLTGALLVGQGLVMENAAAHISRRLGHISKQSQEQYNNLYELRESIRVDPELRATRNRMLSPLLGLTRFERTDPAASPQSRAVVLASSTEPGPTVPSVAELLRPGGAMDQLESLTDSAPAEHHEKLKETLSKLRGTLESKVSLSPNLTVDEISDYEEATRLCASVAEYLRDQPGVSSDSKATAESVRSQFAASSVSWSTVMKTDVYRLEADVTNEMSTLAASLDDTRSAKTDNQVMRWTGRAYGAAGAGLIASLTPLAAVVPGLGPLATGILALAYGANYINTQRNQARTAKSQLAIDAANRQPWAPKVVGAHRELLARQAEQVESDSARNRGMGWRTMGWGVGAMAMGGLTIAGALAATVFSGGIALPVILGVGAGFSLAGSVATFNLFNRHAARNASFGPRPGSTPHLDGVIDSTGRKKFYWGASKQASQMAEQKQLFLERVEKSKQAKEQAASNVSTSSMRRQSLARPTPGKETASLDSRSRLNEFANRFLNPNYTSLKQVRTIKNALNSDWKDHAESAAYSLRLYTEHETNFLRDKANYLLDRQKLFQNAKGSDNLGLMAKSKARELSGQIRETLDALKAVGAFTEKLDAFQVRFSKDKIQSASTTGLGLEPEFKSLINEFIHRMGLVGHSSSRGGIKKLIKNGSTTVSAETYGLGNRFISNIKVNRSADLDDDLALRNHLEGNEYKNFANLMVYVLPDMINYEIQKVHQTELTTRRPDLAMPQPTA